MGLFDRLKRTREAIGNVFRQTAIDANLFDELEDQLILADYGVEAATEIVDAAREQHRRQKFADDAALIAFLRERIEAILNVDEQRVESGAPRVMLMVGVNGVGKTTTTARLARHYQLQGEKIMLAACDTFRAAAVEQLQMWGERLAVPVIAQQTGSDAAAVAHDAINAARSQGIDRLLIDTAGRQHTHSQLMDQLEKVRRTVSRQISDAPHDTWLTVDATTGQNAISQFEHFNRRTPINGICVTKLDGTAKGGIVVSLAHRFKVPIRYLGIGEQMDDLQVFNAHEFAKALIPDRA